VKLVLGLTDWGAGVNLLIEGVGEAPLDNRLVVESRRRLALVDLFSGMSFRE
jgi:hypothetical protein